MSVLSVVQHVCGRTNVPVPVTVLGNADRQVTQMLRLLEEEGNDLSTRGDWNVLSYEATVTTLANQSQGYVATWATNGFRHIRNDTFWDRTNKLPILGPLTEREWQQIQAMTTTGPRYRYRIKNNLLLATPTPPAGLTWVFEYISKNWLQTADLTTYLQYASLDTNNILLPEDLVIAGLRWRWMREKGFDYAELFNTYEHQVKNALGRDGGKRTLRMDGGSQDARPGIFVSPMSWNLP